MCICVYMFYKFAMRWLIISINLNCCSIIFLNIQNYKWIVFCLCFLLIIIIHYVFSKTMYWVVEIKKPTYSVAILYGGDKSLRTFIATLYYQPFGILCWTKASPYVRPSAWFSDFLLSSSDYKSWPFSKLYKASLLS